MPYSLSDLSAVKVFNSLYDRLNRETLPADWHRMVQDWLTAHTPALDMEAYRMTKARHTVHLPGYYSLLDVMRAYVNNGMWLYIDGHIASADDAWCR